jgi:glycosyltransferase involved in cell wall biosynthesis
MREEAIAAFLDAYLFLFPSWIECSPLVLFEAAAARTPFLVTDVGNAAEIIRWTGGGRLLPGKRINDRQGRVQADVQAGARELDALMADRDRRLHMAASAHQALSQHFSWSRITDQYERLYKTLLDGSSIQGLFPAPPAITP